MLALGQKNIKKKHKVDEHKVELHFDSAYPKQAPSMNLWNFAEELWKCNPVTSAQSMLLAVRTF